MRPGRQRRKFERREDKNKKMKRGKKERKGEKYEIKLVIKIR